MSLTIFMVFVLVIGIVVAVISQQIDDRITSVCSDKDIIRSSKALVVLSTICVILPIAHFVCNATCSDKRAYSADVFIYLIFLGLLGVTLTVLGGVLLGVSKKTPECDKIETQSWIIIALGGVLTLMAIGFYVLNVKGKGVALVKDELTKAQKTMAEKRALKAMQEAAESAR